MALSYAISALPAIVTYASGDLLPIVDISDFTEAPTGTTKKITVAQLFTAPTFTGLITGTGNLTLAGNVQLSTSGSFASVAASMQRVTASGLVLTTATGGTYDFVLATAAGVPYLHIDTGSTTVKVDNTLAVAGPILPTGGFTGALTPTTTATYDLGTSGNRWNNLFLSAGITAAGAITGATLAGALSTAAQPAITSVGTLTSLTVSGLSTMAVVSATALTVSGLINTTTGIATGSNPASAGAVRLANGQGIKMRNAANTADVDLIFGVINDVGIGTGTQSVYICSSGGSVGFYGTTPQALATITGSRGGNAALTSLLTALNAMGLISNATTV